MHERAAPFLVFADLAFFLFAVLALSYQYVQVVESGDAKILTDSLLVDLVRLPFTKKPAMAAPAEKPDDTFDIAILKDDTFLLNAKPVTSADFEAALQAFKNSHCRLLVDRKARAEALVLVLGFLEQRNNKSIEIEFIAEDINREDNI